MQTLLSLLTSALLLVFATSATFARTGEIVEFGVGQFTGDTRPVVVQLSRRDGRFDKLLLTVERSNAVINEVTVVYGNGVTQRLLREPRRVEAGQRLELNLAGEARALREVRIAASPARGARRTDIRVAGQTEPPPAPRERFVVLETVEYRTGDREVVIPIGASAGAYDRIRIRALDQPALIRRAEVVFSNGQRQEIRLRERLAADEVSDAIELAGDRSRRINSVVLALRPAERSRRARLEILGNEADRPSRPPPPIADTRRFDQAPRTDRRGYPIDYVLFGTVIAGRRGNADVIEVGPSQGQFERIALVVRDSGIQLNAVTFVYANGERDRVVIERRLPADSVSPAILLTGDRFIREIEIDARALRGGDGPAAIEAFGLYSERWLARLDRGDRTDRGRDEGWALIGAQRAQMFNVDADVFPVGRRFGLFDQIRVRARGTTIRLYGLTITYGNGTKEEIDLFGRLGAGETSAAIELRGRERFIESIQVRYRSTISLRGEGLVEVWGRQVRGGRASLEDELRRGVGGIIRGILNR